MCFGDESCGSTIGVPDVHFRVLADGRIETLSHPHRDVRHDRSTEHRDGDVARVAEAGLEVWDPMTGLWIPAGSLKEVFARS